MFFPKFILVFQILIIKGEPNLYPPAKHILKPSIFNFTDFLNDLGCIALDHTERYWYHYAVIFAFL